MKAVSEESDFAVNVAFDSRRKSEDTGAVLLLDCDLLNEGGFVACIESGVEPLLQ